MRRTLISGAVVLVGAVALVVIGVAGGAQAKKPALSATPVFKLHLKPSQEVPADQGPQGERRRHVTFDLTRNAAGAITSGEVIFYFNYTFPGPVHDLRAPHPSGCEGRERRDRRRLRPRPSPRIWMAQGT